MLLEDIGCLLFLSQHLKSPGFKAQLTALAVLLYNRAPVPLEIDRRQVDKTLSRFRVQGACPRSDVCVTAPLERRRRRWGTKLASTVPAAPHHSTKCSNLKVHLQHCRRVQQHCRRAHRFSVQNGV